MLFTRKKFLILLLVVLTGCTATAQQAEIQNVVVIGATGQTGRLVVADLRQAGYTVRAFVRDADKARSLLGADVEIMTGDVKDPANLQQAMLGMDAVISSIGASGATGPDRPEKVDYEGVRNIADAAAAGDIKHLVLVSSMGATHEDHPLNKMFGDVLLWKRKGELAVQASGVPYTIIRPGGLVNEPGGKGRIQLEQGDRRGEATVPRADVATLCVIALQNPASRFKTFEVGRVKGEPVTDWQAEFASLASDPL